MTSFQQVREKHQKLPRDVNRCHIPEEENKDGNRQDESTAEERAGAAVAIDRGLSSDTRVADHSFGRSA
jgi:hypothetical protein